MSKLSFIHRFEKGTRRDLAPLLLLHGTGGDENDLIPLGRMVAPDRALLSVRGQVLEGGAPRFFRRLAEGVFDEADVVRRAHELADFIDAARKEYGISAPVALGYSNGANIAAAMLLLRPQALGGAVLLRAMAPLAKPPQADLAAKSVLLLSGQHDPIVPPGNVEGLAKTLAASGARVEGRVLPVGHQLSQLDVNLAREWLAEQALTGDSHRNQTADA
ncbi:alpha/beta hydrolase [Bradyrhizobium sp. CB82]|uniref:alpha/beta hydrolase n=1 Tax=Bradyrhizobium sp. CB82 TaxID=3039159 RepID=UPI0024B12045|nr:alpha/beta hydrolase [Bradyrhizobium sp. CB82]WFU38291.1 alpha/beta hydrolase [Bradyrhizobium sp. CB82]